MHLDDTDIRGWSAVNFGIRLRGRTPHQIADIILQSLEMRLSGAAATPIPAAPSSFVASPSAAPTPSSDALTIWQEKLDYLKQQEAIISDASQKFTIKKQIEEAQQKITELGGNPR